MAKIIKTNFSGDILTFEYATDEEADTLFDMHCMTSSQCELHVDYLSRTYLVYNKKLDKIFECYK